jgi:hypothetical protein
MYDRDAFLVPNTKMRYSLGDRSRMKFDDDISLTIYVQNNSPGKYRDANWLPAPRRGRFQMKLRLYAPKKEVIDGTWKPPPVERVK